MFGAMSVSGLVLCALVSVAPVAMAAEQSARGDYLASHVAMCVQCHTPRDGKGDLDRTRLFKGAPIPLRSPFPPPRLGVRGTRHRRSARLVRP